MKIRKILNNNSALVLDEDNQEVVVIGKAIAFKKKVGDVINPAAIEKKFCLSSQSLNAKFQEVLVSLPLEEISVVSKIIDEIKMRLGKKISDSIYVSLSDHIHFALKNYEKGNSYYK
ncbi:MAG: CAT RNA binding domain-containing protein [Erysipelotrichaceae bacterium]|nr:CAT RNA binding domain-containing protein [Erysipelotrichaceae bacterium]